MFNNKKSILGSSILFIILITALGGSYYYFNTYHPKVLRKIAEVRGIKTRNIVDLPHPELIEKLDSSKIKGYNHMTYRTTRSPLDIQSFYENIFDEKEWELESIILKDNELVMEYKSQDKKVTIQAIQENPDGNTLVSIQEAER